MFLDLGPSQKQLKTLKLSPEKILANAEQFAQEKRSYADGVQTPRAIAEAVAAEEALLSLRADLQRRAA
ncbi:MAG: hypothetical protein WCW27_03610 [Patescibacteria group bacterium]|jgi:hypothetical protein